MTSFHVKYWRLAVHKFSFRVWRALDHALDDNWLGIDHYKYRYFFSFSFLLKGW